MTVNDAAAGAPGSPRPSPPDVQAAPEGHPGAEVHQGAVDGPVPTGAELAVWRDFLRAHATIAHRLEAELMAEQELPLAWYDVLLQLSEAPGRRLRMTELADRVLLSRSGLTRLVDRLVRDGLVRREPCEDDARGTYSVLTDEGRRRLRVAAPTHLRGIRDHMTRHFAPGELEQLGALLRSLLDAVERSGDHVHGTPQPRRAGD